MSSSLLHLKDLDSNAILSLFRRARRLMQDPQGPLPTNGARLQLVFLEPSTRTQFSFQTAAVRAGLTPLVMSAAPGLSSLEKGESVLHTLLNLEQMGPKAFVLRLPEREPMDEFVRLLNTPVINAGWGMWGHPTQALLDFFTLEQEFQNLNGLKLLFVGDLVHSRVFASHLELAQKFSVEIGLCGPEKWLVDHPGALLFEDLQEGLSWCDGVMTYRCQFERMSPEEKQQTHFLTEFKNKYGINRSRLKHLRAQGVLLHPGPVGFGLELDPDVDQDSRVRILSQVKHGVFVREALLRQLLEEK